MKAKEFRETYELDRNRHGLIATEKAKLPKRRTMKIWTVADGTAYNSEKTYFFFDTTGIKQVVRTTQGLRADQARGVLDSFGLSVVSICRLRNSEAEALDDGVEHYRKMITDAEKEIAKIEKQKVKVNDEN